MYICIYLCIHAVNSHLELMHPLTPSGIHTTALHSQMAQDAIDKALTPSGIHTTVLVHSQIRYSHHRSPFTDGAGRDRQGAHPLRYSHHRPPFTDGAPPPVFTPPSSSIHRWRRTRSTRRSRSTRSCARWDPQPAPPSTSRSSAPTARDK